MNVFLVAMASPVVLYAVGAWLETIGTIDCLADEFYSRWPLTTIGALVGVLTVLRV